MQAPKLFIFVGYPGAGKTSVAKIIEQRTGAVHLWADHIRQSMFMAPTHSRDESKALYDKLNRQTGELLAAGKSVIFDTNFNFYYDRELLRHIAQDNGAETVLVWVTTAQNIAHDRAVHESHGKHTRIYGNMSDADFQRIAGNLQPPKPEEHAITINGVDLHESDVYTALNI